MYMCIGSKHFCNIFFPFGGEVKPSSHVVDLRHVKDP